MKQKELEKLVEEFVEKVKENETIQESDLGEFLVDKEICEMSEIERNYILRSAQAITYKDRYDKSSTSTRDYITQKCIDTVIGEHKLSGRYEKQCQDALERCIQEAIRPIMGYIKNSSTRDPKFNRRRMAQIYFGPHFPINIDIPMFGNEGFLIPFELKESIPNTITSNLDKNNDLNVFKNLSHEDKESVYYAVEKELRKTVCDRLRNVKVEFSNLNDKSNVVTEGIEHVYFTVESGIEKVIKNIFVKHIMDKDIQSIPESDIKDLKETWLNKALKRIEYEADKFNNVYDLSANKLDKGKTDKEFKEIVKDVFSKYKKTFPERFDKFLMSTGTTINKVRKEIIQKRSINTQKISPTKCTPEELETLFRNIIKKYEKSRKNPNRTDSYIDESEIMNLVGLYTTYFGNKKNKFPEDIKNYQSDFNIIKNNSYKDENIKVFTTDNGVSFYAITYLNEENEEKVTKHVKFVYIEDKTKQLRVFTPLKGNFVDLDKMEAFSSDSLDYIRKTYSKQAKELFKDMDERAIEEYYNENILDLFKYNEKVCLEEFESACK